VTTWFKTYESVQSASIILPRLVQLRSLGCVAASHYGNQKLGVSLVFSRGGYHDDKLAIH